MIRMPHAMAHIHKSKAKPVFSNKLILVTKPRSCQNHMVSSRQMEEVAYVFFYDLCRSTHIPKCFLIAIFIGKVGIRCFFCSWEKHN
jgi:hypothetical protein